MAVRALIGASAGSSTSTWLVAMERRECAKVRYGGYKYRICVVEAQLCVCARPRLIYIYRCKSAVVEFSRSAERVGD